MTTPAKPRKTLRTLGRRGRQVRVFLEAGHELVRVQWREAGAVRTQSWPNTTANRATAIAFAEGVEEAQREGKPAEQVKRTLRQLWDGFQADHFAHLRPNTQRIYGEGWRYYELFIGRDFPAEDVTLEMVTKFRRELERRGLKVSVIRNAISTAKLVYKWAQRQELLGKNRLALYTFRVGKDQRTASPAEYRREEFVQLLAQLDPASGRQWRAHVALALCGYQGRRQHAVLHLQWADVDLEAREVTWRARWDKVGKEETTPLRAGAIRALELAHGWRERTRYTGPWVLPAANRRNTAETYSLQSLWTALKGAEARAGIAAEQGRGGHGLRRMLAGDVWEATGDAALALQAIGDTDMRQAKRYLKTRDDRVRRTFDTLDAQERAEAATAARAVPTASTTLDDTPEHAPKAQPNRNDNGAPDTGAPLGD